MITFEKFTKGIGGKTVFCVGLVLELLCEKLNLIFRYMKFLHRLRKTHATQACERSEQVCVVFSLTVAMNDAGTLFHKLKYMVKYNGSLVKA